MPHAGVVRALLVTVLASALSAPGFGQNTSPGAVNFFRLSTSTLDPYLTNPTAAQQTFLQTHFTRMGVYSSFFDPMTLWYPNGIVYQDMYAIYNPSTIATQHPDWILHDPSGNLMYIPWGCAGGTCPQYAADIANPNFRLWWISQMQATMARGTYRGMFIDDVNMDMSVGDNNGNLVAPIDDATGAPMTATAWRAYVAQFVTQIRQAFPTKQIIHNSVWYAGPAGVRDLDPSIQKQIAAADVLDIERGIGSDTGLTGGTGDWSIYSLFGYIDRVHQAGKGALMLQYDLTDPVVAQYSLAGYFLISNGLDYHGDTSTTPDNWWTGLNTNLGTPLGPRTYSNGVYQRNFSQGIVILGEPGLATPVTVKLPATFTTLAGAAVNSVTVSASQGIILTGTYPNPPTTAVSLTTLSLPNGAVGAGYNAALAATGGSGTYSYSVSGAPPGVVIVGSALAGMPSTAGTYSAITVKATDSTTGASAQKTFSATIYAALTVSTTALPNGTAGAAYSATLAATGGSGTYRWSATNLPTGLAISGSTLSGIPTAAVSGNVILTVTDTATSLTAQKSLALNIYGTPIVSNSTLPVAVAGTAWSAALSATGGSGSYTWAASGLPAGIALSGSTLSGTVAAAGAWNVTLTVTDATTKLSSQKTMTFNCYGVPVISTTALPAGSTGVNYSATLSATGGSGNYTWTGSGIPSGLALNGNLLAGTPAAAATANIAFTVTDTTTKVSAQKTLSLVISAPLTVTTATLPAGTVGSAYTATLAASGGSGSYTWTAAGLPAGLSLTGSTIAGTPTAAATANVTLTATDTATKTGVQKIVSITIYSFPAITTSVLPAGTVGAAYSAALSASGGSGNYSWTATSLPAGVTLTGATIGGTPTTAGTFNAVLTLTDTTLKLTAQKTFAIAVASAPAPVILPGPMQTPPSAIISRTVAASNSDGRLEVFALLSDNALWHSWQLAPDGSWAAWQKLGGSLAGDPAVVRNADGRLEVFVLGTDHGAWHIAQTAAGSATWGALSSLGGYITSNIGVAANSDGRLQIVVRGGDQSVYTMAQTTAGGTWTAWTALGGTILSNPTIIANADGRLQIFALGTDSGVWSVAQNSAGSAFGGWVSLGGSISGDTVPAINTDGRVQVFAKGTDNGLWVATQNTAGTAFGAFGSLGGVILSSPGVGINADGRIDVFVPGTDNAIWHRTQTTAGGSWSGWSSLGGSVDGQPDARRNSDGKVALFDRGLSHTAASTFLQSAAGTW